MISSFEWVLDNVNPEKLNSFLVRYAAQNPRFERDLLAAFGRPDVDGDISDTKERIKTISTGRLHKGVLSYDDAHLVESEFLAILAAAELRAECAQPMLAANMALLVATKTAQLTNKYLPTAAITAKCSGIFARLGAGPFRDGEKSGLFERVLKEAKLKSYANNSELLVTLLDTAIGLIEPKSAKKFFDALSYIQANYPTKAAQSFAVYRLKAIRAIQGDEEYEKELAASIDIEEVRMLAVEHAIERKDYREAERLCLEMLTQATATAGPRFYRAPNRIKWDEVALGIYNNAQDPKAQTDLALKLFFDFRNPQHYETVRALLVGMGIWENEKEAFLDRCESIFPQASYLGFLRMENESEKIFEYVSRFPELIVTNGKYLSETYPNEVEGMFRSQIDLLCEKRATDYSAGRAVCEYVKAWANTGPQAREKALALLREMTRTYYRSRSFVRELRALELDMKPNAMGY